MTTQCFKDFIYLPSAQYIYTAYTFLFISDSKSNTHCHFLSVIVRVNQAEAKDGGQPISLIFSAFKTFLIRIRLVLFK